MKSIKNKTNGPLRVPLPRGKVLHLGPQRTGQINDPAADHPPFKKLVEDGKIEIVEEGAQAAASAGVGSAVHVSSQGAGPKNTMRKTGDR